MSDKTIQLAVLDMAGTTVLVAVTLVSLMLLGRLRGRAALR